ncbi:MAG: FtsX-like permease family protein [Gemmatimonadetes bacterium]|uniref:FtsX-like permease family protein n=1 Tax=Candidatus Kutchimonas denitrificans TaxID=3056748 RepID=A0AAE4Z5D6_9BACT|nr:FtsX-like permease family protein [Gemmatimonadota bacterium]NIR74094.1 FtsX-like permease family protein [Candidatus Kutchimonas denitrificans]NIS01656.1 FtsX-like permease family protein [Gemmatimonadota bacterium]NIT67394.1 FtsX-like permease family protein [Gemmatimonadota bacterium]NIU52757.1 FtsX-like permease family protein [Gemmatimonadota bacterium]
MKWVRNVSLSRKALWRHKTRTVLALTSMGFGVAAVLAMVAIGEGAEREVVARLRAMGRNMLVVSAAPAERRGGRSYTRGATVETLTLGDAEAIGEQSGLVVRSAPSLDVAKQVTFLDRSTTATVRGTTPEYGLIRAFPARTGRYFTAEENRAGLRVAVLGSQVAERLFPESEPVGQVIRIGRVPFEVVGVLISKGISVDGSAEEDNQVIVPINTALRRLFDADYLKMIYLEVGNAVLMDEAAEEVAAILRDRHRLARRGRPDDFTILNQRVVIETELATVASFRRMITGMGAVALVVGGVGILSIMLLSVRERRAEIGLRVAVGARGRDVWLQFLIEAVALGGTGGLLGLVLGFGSSRLVSAITEWTAVVTPTAIAAAFASALSVGVLFGVYPAFRAASWPPIEALRTNQ